jgi:hypothetical protein
MKIDMDMDGYRDKLRPFMVTDMDMEMVRNRNRNRNRVRNRNTNGKEEWQHEKGTCIIHVHLLM